MHELESLGGEGWLLFHLRVTDMNLREELAVNCIEPLPTTNHWCIKFVQIPPFLAFGGHHVNFSVIEMAFIPHVGESLPRVHTQLAVLSSKERDSARMLK